MVLHRKIAVGYKRLLTYVKWSFAGLSVASILVAGYLMLTAKHSIQEVLDVAAIKAGSRVESPDIREYNGDHLSWRLRAKSALEQNNVLNLDQPVIDLYTENQQVIPIQSDVGVYYKKKGVVHFSGKVKMGYQGWILNSDRLDFYQEKRVLHVQKGFVMQKKGIEIVGKNMRVMKDAGRVTVSEGVHMTIEENR